MPAKKSTSTVSIYQIKVTLKDSKPPIWRRLQVKSNTTLAEMHDILQIAMGWTDSHLHQFTAFGEYYGVPDPDNFVDVIDERKVKLDRVFSGLKSKITYEYDFGDSWEHILELEKIFPPEVGAHYPVCLTGKRACPPEDCGGIWGYSNLLEAIHDPNHPEHEDMLEWLGGEFDPVAFDLEEVNKLLR